MTVKLLLLEASDRVLLIEATGPTGGQSHWDPVGGGVEPGESLAEAARREAREEVGLRRRPPGEHVWTREHTYCFDGRTVEVHEDWLLHRVERFEPVPTALSAYESRTIHGFRWWTAAELAATDDTVFPPDLGARLSVLLRDGTPRAPIDISTALR